MKGQWPRVIAALVVFAVATAIGTLLLGRFDTAPDPVSGINQVTADSFALILASAVLLAAAAFFALEYRQTGTLASIAGQFTTRTFALMPVAIAINIALGAAVGYALKVPIYLDSIGTILVGVLCGPLAGAVTGGLGNILWSYVVPPPFQSPPSAAFALVAVMIGLIAGLVARAGVLTPRPNRGARDLLVGGTVAIVLVAGMGVLAIVGYGQMTTVPNGDSPILVGFGWLAVFLVVTAELGLIALLAVRKDVSSAYAVVSGAGTGVICALISAPIAAGVFGGVTGAGTDFLVAALRQGGASLQAATLGQGLISDPIDKAITFSVVYVIVGSMARRTRARFPQGERLLETDGAETAPAGAGTLV